MAISLDKLRRVVQKEKAEAARKDSLSESITRELSQHPPKVNLITRGEAKGKDDQLPFIWKTDKLEMPRNGEDI